MINYTIGKYGFLTNERNGNIVLKFHCGNELIFTKEAITDLYNDMVSLDSHFKEYPIIIRAKISDLK